MGQRIRHSKTKEKCKRQPNVHTRRCEEFTTDLSFNTSLGGTLAYFTCDSSCITFDGSNNTCTINSITNYRGLIQNGTRFTNGNHSIIVKNIKINLQIIETYYIFVRRNYWKQKFYHIYNKHWNEKLI